MADPMIRSEAERERDELVAEYLAGISGDWQNKADSNGYEGSKILYEFAADVLGGAARAIREGKHHERSEK